MRRDGYPLAVAIGCCDFVTRYSNSDVPAVAMQDVAPRRDARRAVARDDWPMRPRPRHRTPLRESCRRCPGPAAGLADCRDVCPEQRRVVQVVALVHYRLIRDCPHLPMAVGRRSRRKGDHRRKVVAQGLREYVRQPLWIRLRREVGTAGIRHLQKAARSFHFRLRVSKSLHLHRRLVARNSHRPGRLHLHAHRLRPLLDLRRARKLT